MEHRISTVAADEQDRTIATLTAAFIADPFMRWMLPDAEQYLEAFPLILRAFGGASFEHDQAFATPDFSGATMWLPPGVGADEEAMGELIERWVEPAKQEDLMGVLESMEEYHPEDDVTWYLPTIGVDPHYQRRGIGAALLQHRLRGIDAEGRPAYLESSNPMNMSLYERHGFRSTGRIEIGSAPPIHPMLRPARSA